MISMNEKEYDRLHRIKTTDLGERAIQSSHYSHYEATSYSLLNILFQEYKLKNSDGFVDYGCGKGRVLFYVHNRFQASVTGIEMNENLYQKAIINQTNYIRKVKNNKATINIECCLAEKYDVKVTENRFYFFNPFSIQIFRKVVDNILRSVEKKQREVDIILYYPTPEYIEYLETETPFELFQEVKVSGLYQINNNERIVILRFGK